MSSTVGVLGAGIMGRGIAQVFAAAGHAVVLCDVDQATAERGHATIRAGLERAARKGGGPGLDLLERIEPAGEVSAFTGAGLVIEAVPEDLDLKHRMLTDVAAVTGRDTVLASNTSALPITAIAAGVPGPERVIGLHFFNPVHRMDLVEMVCGLQTAPATETLARELCESAGKVVVRVSDRPGFVTSRVNVLIGNEAFHMLSEGVAGAEEIDTALKHGLNHPMGPFELIDLVGLDTRLSVLRGLHESLGDRFRPDPLLVSLVQAGRLGRKTGHGVYRYDENGKRVPGSGDLR
ncbi:3-hydroxyacyl-CoA dehydrogenase family protein [Amycolatopsis sp. K13G38]|uniref:3-hydroxyacyl-CoA dehydrogenase family protein n=1 Tax=Amycolatopsis acididurans TaxID=2724524 RepID=A0ABX1IWB4_9PSEU|nr:3-hydroxyacyl-CoA dehydrogenase family protein [Amycolatopsis acididurans]NKQ51773.1 3-hydroxyacyl-CoA dehydrogenase family protein [Amycolatopsis acididurans]